MCLSLDKKCLGVNSIRNIPTYSIFWAIMAGTAILSDLLQVSELSKSFGGHQAVKQVSFSLAAGSIGGLIGPNGAGKTTLFNCLAGFMPASSGRVLLDGVSIAGAPSSEVFAAGLARTFQIPRPFPQMTVLDNVMVAPTGQLGERFWSNWLRPGAVAQQEIATREAARYWLEFVGLSSLEQQAARVLSGGQRKLLELARVMVSKPKLVLLDEPGAGVNPALLDQITDKIVALNAQGTTFLIIEHNMDLVAKLCRPVMVMSQGELLTSGDAHTVLNDPRVIEAYLGDAA
jgi:branched-chain amino acid transport system ATP-binding protein